ncbi:hypothetical protein [Coralloluteibacterium thermophilus]|uniref:Lipoprotein n=1 Tax=Coralloluteibacterium thermophilum TaxID=2707049 RepID=A0ABV9NHG5_9GAMM
MSIRHRLAAACLGALLIAGCKPDTTPPDRVFAQPGVVFTLSPPQAPDCHPDTVYKATVAWSITGQPERRLEVRVGSRGGAEFLRTSQARGREETGEWVRPGTWFLLVDRRSKEVLATLRAGPEPCPGGEASEEE